MRLLRGGLHYNLILLEGADLVSEVVLLEERGRLPDWQRCPKRKVGEVIVLDDEPGKQHQQHQPTSAKKKKINEETHSQTKDAGIKQHIKGKKEAEHKTAGAKEATEKSAATGAAKKAAAKVAAGKSGGKEAARKEAAKEPAEKAAMQAAAALESFF